jgi:hypothetical protein
MEQKGIDFASIPQTAIKFITSPASFYKDMPKKGGFVEPLVFMVAMGVIGGLIQAVVSLLGLQLAAGMAMGIASIVYVPIGVAIFGFIGAAIIFVIWKVMGSTEDYETAYRCGAYASAFTPILMVINLIPYAGMVVTTLIWVYLLVVASVEVHNIPSGKAWLVFGIIGAVLVVVGISGQIAARKLAGDMQETTKRMEDASKAMQDSANKMQEEANKAAEAQQQQQQTAPAPAQGDAAQQAAQAQGAANQQMDATISRMEEQMKNMPPAQQEQMRLAIEQMKKSRDQAGR